MTTKIALSIFLLFNLSISQAQQDIAAGRSIFNISGVKFVVTDNNVDYYYNNKKIAESTINPGGWWSPYPFISENGEISLGNSIFNPKYGIFEKKISNNSDLLMLSTSIKIEKSGIHSVFVSDLSETNTYRCNITLDRAEYADDSAYSRISNGSFHAIAGMKHKVGFLYERKKNKNSNISKYEFDLLNIKSCSMNKYIIPYDDGYPSVGWNSKGGWWIVGVINQTLLHSTDGIHWSNINLPKNIFRLIDAYFQSKNNIWLSAGIANITTDDDPGLLYSSDGGRHWDNISRLSPKISHVPKFWLQGQNQVNYSDK